MLDLRPRINNSSDQCLYTIYYVPGTDLSSESFPPIYTGGNWLPVGTIEWKEPSFARRTPSSWTFVLLHLIFSKRGRSPCDKFCPYLVQIFDSIYRSLCSLIMTLGYQKQSVRKTHCKMKSMFPLMMGGVRRTQSIWHQRIAQSLMWKIEKFLLFPFGSEKEMITL